LEDEIYPRLRITGLRDVNATMTSMTWSYDSGCKYSGEWEMTFVWAGA